LRYNKFIWSMLVIMILIVGGNLLAALDWNRQPLARNGVLDLREWDGLGKEMIKLQGEWEFYPGELWIGGGDREHPSYPILIVAPGNWSKEISIVSNRMALGVGTYRLLIKLDSAKVASQTFFVPLIRSSHRFYANNELAGVNGETEETADRYSGQTKPYMTQIQIQDDTIELVIQVSNFDFAISGGIIQPIVMGPLDLVAREQSRTAAFEFGNMIVYILFALCFGAMHARVKTSGWHYLSLLFVCSVIVVSVQSSKWILWLLPDLSTSNIYSVHWLGSTGIISCWLLFVSARYTYRVNMTIKRILLILLGIFAICVICIPLEYVSKFWFVWLFIVLCAYGYVFIVFLQSLQNKSFQSKFEFLAFFLFAAISFLNMLRFLGIIGSNGLYFIQILGFSIVMLLLILLQFFRSYRKTLMLAKKLKRNDKIKNEFMASISEQMTAPLQAIVSIANARLQSEEKLTSDQINDLRLITAISWSTGNMVGDLRDFSKIREKDIVLQLQTINLYSVMNEAIERFGYLPHNERIVLINNIAQSVSPIWADEQRFNQILNNLMTCMIRMIGQGSIIVQAFNKENAVDIQFMMRGSSLSKEWQAGPAQMLNQNDESYRAGYKDPFLGLYLVREIVLLHHGAVRLQADSDQEAAIVLTFPINKEFPDLTVNKDRTSSSGHTVIYPQNNGGSPEAHILLIVNDTVNVTVMMRLLALDNYKVTAIQDGAEAIGQIRKTQVDLVIVDRTLLGETGLALCRRLREWYTMDELPILLLTSGGYPDHGMIASEAGANDFLVKPVESSELRVRVRTLLHMKRAVSERIRMELAFLQAQIKPHFLFNTLNSISALSKSEPKQMIQLLTEFGHYLRESFRFDNTDILVPFKRELRLVKSYLHIEQIRFAECLTYHIDILTEHFRIPPLIIQPLVENAVRHGIMKRAIGGQVWLHVSRFEHHILIIVKDNGVGMNPAMLEQLQHASSSGVGIQNIERRLKRLFGFGLTIYSELGKGTEIQIRLPIEKVGFHELEDDTGGR